MFTVPGFEMSTLSPINNLTVKWYLIGRGTKQGKLLQEYVKTRQQCAFQPCFAASISHAQIKRKERYLAHISVIAKTANEMKRSVRMWSNRWLPPSLPWCWAHSSFTLISQNNLSFDRKHKLLSSETCTPHAHASKEPKANTNSLPFRWIMCMC